MVIPTKSGILLLFSCVAFIAVVGCVFELSSGEPSLGQWQTIAILALSVPFGLFTFIAAARVAKASIEKG
jgi:ABC-type Na+ efflux pump permease subunit